MLLRFGDKLVLRFGSHSESAGTIDYLLHGLLLSSGNILEVFWQYLAGRLAKVWRRHAFT
jgi:hypothetical protein